MTLVLLSIWYVGREFIDAVDSISQQSLSIHWRFQGLQGLGFRWRFMDQQQHSVFDNFMCQPWLYFSYWFDASVITSVTLLIPYVNCHLVFSDDLRVYRHSVCADDLWISRDIVFLIIPSLNHDSIFAIDLMRRSWIQWRCWFHTAVVTQYSLTISRFTGTLFLRLIYGSTVTLHFWQFHVQTMTLFLLSIWCVSREFIDVVDSI